MHDALKDYLKQNDIENNIEKNFELYYNLLYSVYSLPNVFLPFLGGILITRYGNRIMYLIFGTIISIGQLFFAIGVEQKSIIIMLIGRVIFGLGGECLGLSMTGFIVKWFSKNEIGLPLGLSISICRLGSLINGVFTPRLANVRINIMK